MLQVLDPFRFVLIAVAGWMNQREYQIIDYLPAGFSNSACIWPNYWASRKRISRKAA
jgi:hypothetical protein